MSKQYNFINDNTDSENADITKGNDNINKMFYSGQINVPKSLLPENIKKRLEDMDEKELTDARQRADKNFSSNSAMRRITIGGAATVAAACIAGIILFSSSFGTLKTAAPEKISDIIDESIVSSSVVENSSLSDGAPKSDNYSAAYESIKKYKRELAKEDMADVEYLGSAVDGAMNEGASDDIFSGGSSSGAILKKNEGSASSSSSAKSSYSDTNIRTSGVDEGDIVKTDGTYIYVLNKNSHPQTVTIYRANGKKTKKISSISFEKNDSYNSILDMYIYKDRLIVTENKSFDFNYSTKEKNQVKALYKKENSNFNNFNAKSWGGNPYVTCDVGEYYPYDTAHYTITYVYDLNNAKKPKLLHEFFQDGSYDNSRMVDGILYLFSSRSFNTKKIDKKDPTSYIPQIGGECVEDCNVSVPYNSTGINYTVISSIDTENCIYIDKHAVLNDDTPILYVSSNNIYLISQEYFTTLAKTKSTIVKLSYKDGKINKLATGKFKGYIYDDYCIDEKDGMLRFVTTYYNKNGNELNGLFIMDENLKLTGKITNLAKNENIYSALFIYNTAYFVTYRNTDPLFAVDVSDPENPKMLGYLKIPGFSSYLHPYSSNLLLGIGEETYSNGNPKGIKMSMFDISNPAKIKEVAKKVIEGSFDCEAESNPNALFIDTDKNIFGFGLEEYSVINYRTNNSEYKYMVYSYSDKKGFVNKLNYSIFNRKDTDIIYNNIYYGTFSRGIYINDDFYVVTTDDKNIITSFDLKTFKKQ